MKIRLFIKPYCGWCYKAMRWLDDHDIAYEKIDVIADNAAFAEMVRISGQELAPVLEVDGQSAGGFRPGRIAKILGVVETLTLLNRFRRDKL
jgi:glutaredoxin